MKRYTRSFLGFMEMNKDGTWCKYEDLEKEVLRNREDYDKRLEYIKEVHTSPWGVDKIVAFYHYRVLVLFITLTLSLLCNLKWFF